MTEIRYQINSGLIRVDYETHTEWVKMPRDLQSEMKRKLAEYDQKLDMYAKQLLEEASRAVPSLQGDSLLNRTSSSRSEP